MNRFSMIVFGALVLTACRRVPAPECKAGCESDEVSCNQAGRATSDRERACEKRKDECVKGCPTR
jgi:hypothetical protein